MSLSVLHFQCLCMDRHHMELTLLMLFHSISLLKIFTGCPLIQYYLDVGSCCQDIVLLKKNEYNNDISCLDYKMLYLWMSVLGSRIIHNK